MLDAVEILKGLEPKLLNRLGNPRQILITEDEQNFIVNFPYAAAIVFDLKLLPLRRFDVPTQQWVVPAAVQNLEPLIKFARKHKFIFRQGPYNRIKRMLETLALRASGSRAMDAKIHIPGWTKNPDHQLLPFQKADVVYACRCDGRFIDGDEQGLGKTPVGLAVLEQYEAYPAVVVTMATLKDQWLIEGVKKFLPGRTAEVIDLENVETNTFDKDIEIINYDIVKLSPQWYMDRNRPIPPAAKKFAGYLDKLRERDNKGLIFDEIHLLKNPKSQRGEACLELARDVPHIIGLTGTVVTNRPLDLVHPLRIMRRLDDMGGFYHFTSAYCGVVANDHGSDYKGASDVEELNERLRQTCYIRHDKREVYPELPAVRPTIVPMKLSNRDEYTRAQDDFFAYISETRDEDTAKRMRKAKAFAQIEILKQLSIAGKMKAIENWVNDYIEASDEKLIIFAHHIDAQQEIFRIADKALKAKNAKLKATTLFGSSSHVERNKKLFQTDPDCRVIVVSVQSGGTGHNLTAATNLMICELPWTPTEFDQMVGRAYGRISDMHGVNVYVPLSSGTIDWPIWKLLEKKRLVTTGVTSGRKGITVDDVKEELIKRFQHNLETV